MTHVRERLLELVVFVCKLKEYLSRISFGISFIDNDAVKGVVLLKCTYHNSVGSFLIQDLLDILLKLHGRKV